VGRQFEKGVKDPLEPTVWIRAEPLMDHHPCIEIGCITILVRFEVLLIDEF
jgi:hypothetical protein